MVEEGNRLTNISVAGLVDRVMRMASFEGERSLTGGGTKLVGGKALVDPLSALETVETGRSEDESVALSGGEFFEAGVDVAADIDKLNIGTQREELGSSAGAGSAYGSAEGQGVEGPIGLADPNIAGVGALGDGGEGELRGQFGWKVFERVDGEVDPAFFEGFFDFFDEDAFAVEIRRRDEAGLLHAVASGSDDLELDVIACVAKSVEDVIGLPEGKLGASGANADGILRVIVLATHDFL